MTVMQPHHALQAVLVALCWGANFVAARIALDMFEPFWLLTVRFILVAAILLPFFPKPPGKLSDIVILSVLLGTLHFSLMFAPIAFGLDVSSAVISSQLGVPFSCLLGSILFKDHIGPWRSFGMLISFIGVIIIAGSPRIVEQYWQFMLACSGALAWASGNIFIKRFRDENILAVLGWLSLFAVPQLGFISLLTEQNHFAAFEQATLDTWLALLYTIFISTMLAYGIWYHLMSRFPVTHIVPYSLLVPVFGLAFAQLFFEEPITTQFLLGGACTIAGVAVIVFRRPEQMRMQRQ